YDRLDWTNAFEGGVIWNPGANLPTPANLDIDFTSDMHYRVAGTVSGEQNNGNTILTAGDVNVTGTAEFAVSKYDRDLGTITDATLNSYAFNLQGGFSVLPEIDMNLAGAIAVVTVNDNADNAIYTAIKVQDANVTASTGTDTFGLDGQLDIDYYHSNSAADGYDRLDWTNAFEGGVIWNPGANLPTPANLDIDFTSDMHYRVAGTVSG
ncbi:MAG: hypothetical protein GY914_04720, partial [Prochlorococcus sp.]|nr:hypothetical protein [Prochlorococcus sp.]